MPRYKLTIAYDGTDFCGWQRQEPFVPAQDDRPADQRPSRPAPGKIASGPALPIREGEDRPRVALRTVQHVVEEAVASVVREPVTVMGASRTDAGVHAKGQVAAFTCTGESDTAEKKTRGEEERHVETATEERRTSGWPLERGTDRLLRAINGRLPEDVLVVACEIAGPTFNPIGDCIAKGYSYLLHVAPPPPHGLGLRPLWDRRYVHRVWEVLDAGTMRDAAARFVGEHDFAAFAAAGHGRLSTVRTVFDCRVSESPVQGDGTHRLRIDISGNGFLWNMVRIIAGTLVDVGRGRLQPGDIPTIIESKDRAKAGPTLPPTGLCLEWVKYGEE